MARKKPEVPAEEGAPAWMNTYGDMVTLLLTFFVLLFSFSTINAKKWEEIVHSFSGVNISSISSAGSGGINLGVDRARSEPQPTSGTNIPSSDKSDFDKLYNQIKEHIEDNELDESLTVERTEDTIILRVTDSALFDSGKDIIKDEPMLLSVSDLLEQYIDAIKMIRIEGHTDNVPISSAKFRSNWELSGSRAMNVLQFMLKNTIIPPAKFSAVGYGEYHPVASNDTEDGKARNRRVDFVIESVESED